MKAKLFALLGLIIASTGLALILGSAPAQAAGEKYKWIDANTIQASGGLYNNVTAANNGVLNFPKNGNTFIVFSDGDCDITLTIAPSPDNKTGKLTTQGCDEAAAGFDRDITIADSEKGPPVGTFPAPTETGDEGEAAEDKTSCAVDGIGWIICPVMTFLSQIVDSAYSIVATLLGVQPLVTTGEESSKNIYNAWSIMRNFANVAFVIAFLFIIFSQISSIGITNYGIKKMLPRLIISAVLVNVSYWICAVAIDASNIAGASLKELFDSLGSSFAAPTAKLDPSQTGEGWTGIAGAILAGGIAGGIALYVGLSAFIPIILAALVAIITVFLVLALRQALIILLVIIAPLAFVAYLLPNTENLFKKWRGLLQTLLLMYPIISLIFGASALASTVIMTTAGGSGVTEIQKITMQIMGAGVAIIPLALTPIIMKTAGGVLNRFGGFINNPNKGPFDRMRKGADGYRKRQEGRREIRALNGSKLARATSFGKYRRGAKRNAIDAGVASEVKRSQGAYVAQTAINDEAFRNRMAGGRTLGADATPEALNRALAGAVSAQARIEAEEVTAASAVIKSLNLDKTQMQELAMGGKEAGLDGGSNRAIRAAAMQNVVNSHDVDGVNRLLDDVGNMDAKTRESLADSLQNSKEKPAYVGQGTIAGIRQGSAVVNANTGARDVDASGNEISVSQQLAVNAVNNNTYSVDKIANGDKEELEFIAGVAADPDRATNNAQLAANAQTAKTDPKYSGQISKNANVVDDISNL